MSQTNTAPQQLYNLLVTKDFEPETLDVAGRPTSDPGDSNIFSFDYKTPNQNYGTVVIVLDDSQNLEVYFSDNLGKTMEETDRKDWYDFLYQLRMFAKRNLLTFSLNNLARLKFNMKTMAALKESKLFEGYYGTRKTSYSDQPKHTKIIIKHSRALGEGEARFRHIESVFVETSEGERFKLPFTKLVGAKAMARHVSEGGNPYDVFGQHITEMVNEMNTLASFIRAAKHKNYSGEASHMLEDAIRHYANLKRKAKHMIGQRGYRSELESFDPAAITPVDETVETIRNLFTQQSLDPRVEQALPILAKLQSKPDESDEFASWADQVTEGTWALPDNKEAQVELSRLMSQPVAVGPDATNATELLYDIVGDDKLFDILDDLARRDPDANIWDDPSVINRLKELNIDTSAITQPQQAEPAPTEPNEPTDEQPVQESNTLDWLRRLIK